jgi:hypothetical protein
VNNPVTSIKMQRTKHSSGLDAGLTLNEIKEVLVQLYASAAFPEA